MLWAIVSTVPFHYYSDNTPSAAAADATTSCCYSWLDSSVANFWLVAFCTACRNISRLSNDIIKSFVGLAIPVLVGAILVLLFNALISVFEEDSYDDSLGIILTGDSLCWLMGSLQGLGASRKLSLQARSSYPSVVSVYPGIDSMLLC